MVRFALIAAAGLTLAAAPVAAQHRAGTYDGGYPAYDSGHGQGSYQGGHIGRRSNAVPSNFDWRGQLDRPGDYRCDRFWDASRSDCGDGWRDQRHRASPEARRDYRQLAGHSPRRGYGSAVAAGHARGSTTYHGAYGRPDHVYPGAGVSYGGYSRGHGGSYNSGYGSRSDWCRNHYRSYDPRTGYYRAYSGRLVYCG